MHDAGTYAKHVLGHPIRTLWGTQFGHFRAPNSDAVSEHFRALLGRFGETQTRKRAQKIRKPCAKIRKRAQFLFLVVLGSNIFGIVPTLV